MFEDDPTPPDERLCGGCGRKATRRRPLYYRNWQGEVTLNGYYGRVCWRKAAQVLADANIEVCQWR